MGKKWFRQISEKDNGLRQRMLRTIIMAGGIAVVIAILEILVVMRVSAGLVTLLLLLLLSMMSAQFLMFKCGKYDLASTLLGLVIVVMVMPPLFCMSGGIGSGASVWMALGILYIFVMFTGKKMIFFLVLCLSMYGLTYWLTYIHPDWILPMQSTKLAYIDSFFSVVAVGVIGGAILKIHMRVFEDEHALNIEQKKELEESRDSKNSFFANMSHEIRTPINAIIGLNEMILRTNPDNEVREYAQDIQVAGKMLLNQVNDILDLSQMEIKKMNIVPVPYHIEKLFGELVDLVRVQMAKKELDFHVEIDRNLPSVLQGDEKRLNQVLLNLLDNAVKYTEEGSVTLTVQGENCGEDEIILKIQVVDTGIGIRKEDMEHLYDSYNRLDEKKNTRIIGSGLGLAITKQLVDLMGGEITVDSIYTKGTTFSITLKQKVIDKKPVGAVKFLDRSVEDSETYQPSFEAPEARVLVVDDNDMNSMVASKLLSATKVQVDIANSGDQCLEMTKKKYYDVILLDYMMPIMSGVETLQAIRNQENGLCREAAIIALTGNTLSGAKQMYLEQGFDGYVEKPIQGRLLEKEILQFIPSDIVEYQEQEDARVEEQNQIQSSIMRKRKKVYVTSDCACDVPPELLEKYDIKLMYLYIKTPYGRFADTREIDSDSLSQYMTAESSSAYADSVTVEEFEEFFAEVLTQAEHVVHISLGSKAGKSYGIAVAAAKGFDHVHVVDSGQISCGQGLITLHAAKLATEGKSAHEICEAVEKMRGHVKTGIIMPGADIFYQNGRTGAMAAKLCRVLQLHPFVTMHQKNAVLIGLLWGNLENAWKRGIRWHFYKKRKISKDIVFITHVGCSVKQQEWIKKEVLKCIPFERVIVQNASFTVACNSGMETIGISYYSL